MADRQRPIRTRPMRLTLIGLLVVPLVSLVALWAFAASVTLGNALNERDYNQLVALSASPSGALASHIAQERLDTYSWLHTDPRPPASQLAAARERTNAAVAGYLRMQHAVLGLRPAAARPAQASLISLLGHLPRLRAAADAGVLSPAAAFQAYGKIMDALFDVDSASYQGNELVVDHQTDASIDAARALEYASREAALVSGAAAAHGQMSASERELFASAVADQRLLISDALGTFSPQLRGPWARAYDSRAHQQFMVLENRIAGSIGSQAPIPVNVRTWQTVSRKFLAAAEEADIRVAPPLAALAARTGNRLLLEAVLAGGVGLAAVVASILLTLWFGRRLTGELSTLQDSAEQMAGQRLPSLVQRLRDGQEVDVEAESPPPPPGRITEIAQVAEAFESVQRTAVQAAVGQASLRKGVNQVFLNLSLRNQSLLHRQLGMLDAMERATNEPAALADLFRLDHLTTRMRRHAENLIILSGATPGRGWRDPVPVVDVLRAAIAEVEDYVRVDVASECRDAVVGSAVNDVIHLVAELIENASTFSPPSTRVEIRADGVANGFAVEIEDRGLGLTPAELAEVNARLASPPEFDLANSDQLGLFVVGQLAARQGIKVSLRDSPFGGTTAIVLLPPGLVVRDGETGPPASPAMAELAGLDAGVLPTGPVVAITNRERASVFSLTGRPRLELARSETTGDGPAPAFPVPAQAAVAPDPRPDAPPAPTPPAPTPPPPGAPWPPAPSPAPSQAGLTVDPGLTRDGTAPQPVTAGEPGPRLPQRGPAARGTHRGLPRRMRQASIAPQLRGAGGAAPAAPPAAAAGPQPRSPEMTRSLMSALQDGWQRGRVDDLDDPPGGPDEGGAG